MVKSLPYFLRRSMRAAMSDRVQWAMFFFLGLVMGRCLCLSLSWRVISSMKVERVETDYALEFSWLWS